MKFRAHRDVVAACTRQAEGHARSNGGLPRFRIARRHQQIALETVCAIAAIVIDRLAALTVRGRIKPLAGRSKTLLVGHTATSSATPFWNTCRPPQRRFIQVPVTNDLSLHTVRVPTHFTGGFLSGSHARCGRRARFSAIALAFRFRASYRYRYASSSPRSAVQTHRVEMILRAAPPRT